MKSVCFILIMSLLLSGTAVAASIEITTGSGPDEGVRDSGGGWLKDGCLVQVILARGGIVHPPGASGDPAHGDKLLLVSQVGYNFPFSRDEGKFDVQISAGGGDVIYVRAWNGPTAGQSERYGNSSTYNVRGFDGEMWNISEATNEPAFEVGIKK